MKGKTRLESIAGSNLTNSSITLASILINPMLSVIPIMNCSLAMGRFERRVRESLEEISSRLQKLESRVESLSDEQYQLTGSLIREIFETTSQEKHQFLIQAIENSIVIEGLTDFESVQLARIFSQISAEEVAYLNSLDATKEIEITSSVSQKNGNNKILVPDDTLRAEMVRNLFSIGLLKRAEGVIMQNELYVRTSVCERFGFLIDESVSTML